MNVFSGLPVLASMVLAVAVCWWLSMRYPPPSKHGRFASIDGLRGYLAFAVFMHHGASWLSLLRTGSWETPPGSIYVHMGLAPVEMFFMITAFLFTHKLLASRYADARPVDWTRLFVGRFLRLAPLFYLVVVIVFMLAAIESRGEWRGSLADLAFEIANWAIFTIFGQPDVNGVVTWIMMAGVAWTLPYEILFYLALPLGAAAIGRAPGMRLLLASAVMVVATALALKLDTRLFCAFAAGCVSAVLVRSDRFSALARSNVASVVVVVCLSAAVTVFPVPENKYSLFLLSVVFALVAGGNSLFGVLTHRSARLFGEMAYSIYLLHGLLLYSFFTYVVGRGTAASMTAGEYWLCIIGLVPLLLVVSFLSFRHVEQPPMRLVGAVSRWIDGERKPRIDSIDPASRSSTSG